MRTRIDFRPPLLHIRGDPAAVGCTCYGWNSRNGDMERIGVRPYCMLRSLCGSSIINGYQGIWNTGYWLWKALSPQASPRLGFTNHGAHQIEISDT